MKQLIHRVAFENNLGAVNKYIPLPGGSINHVFLIETERGRFVLKVNPDCPENFFECEKDGLLKLSKYVATPKILGYGTNPLPYLLLQYLEEISSKSDIHEIVLAKHLAKLHHTKNKHYGYHINNLMGSVVQQNEWETELKDFLWLKRWSPIAEACSRNGSLSYTDIKDLENIASKCSEIVNPESPTLVHGDLWNGNVMYTNEDSYLIDPAVCYGHREMDIAMTKMFGGFSDKFYSEYNQYYPLGRDWEKRINYFQIYPLLIHLLLFGKTYYADLKRAINSYA